MAVEVTCRDLETGETQTGICQDGDYILITAGSAYMASLLAHQKYHVITVKGLVPRAARPAAQEARDGSE